MKKTLLVISMLTIMAGFTACTPKVTDSTEVSTVVETSAEETGETTKGAETTKAGDEETTTVVDESTKADSSALRSSDDMRKLFIPEGAEEEMVSIDSEIGSVSLISTDKMEDIIAFYEDSIKTLGAVEKSKTNTGSVWMYAGEYGENDSLLSITITDTSDDIRISASYGTVNQ